MNVEDALQEAAAGFRSQYEAYELEAMDMAASLQAAGRTPEAEDRLEALKLSWFDVAPACRGELHPTWTDDRLRVLDKAESLLGQTIAWTNFCRQNDISVEEANAYGRLFAEPMAGPAMTVTLPDGTDTADPKLRAKIDAKVRETYGPHAVVLYPKLPDVMDGLPTILKVADSRPGATTHTTTAKASEAPRLAAVGRDQGLGELVEFIPERDIATYAQLDPLTVSVRARVAQVLRVEPWDVELVLTGTEARLRHVRLLRAPLPADADRRKVVVKTIIEVLPGEVGRWLFDDDPVTGQFGMENVEDVLAKTQTFERRTAAPIAHVPFGIREDGDVATIRVKNNSGMVVAGLPGAGKTATLTTICGVLAESEAVQFRIWDGKGGSDWEWIAPRAAIWNNDDEDLVRVRDELEALRQEMRWRARNIKELRGHSNIWETGGPSADLPLLVGLLDECQTYFDLKAYPSKEAKALVEEITSIVTSLVKKGRSVGILMIVASQKVTADSIPTPLRDNCAVKLCGRVVTDAAEVAALGERGDPSPLDLPQDPGYVIVNLESGERSIARSTYLPEDLAAEIAKDTSVFRSTELRRLPEGDKSTEKFAVIDEESDDSLDIVRVVDEDVAGLDADDIELDIDLSDGSNVSGNTKDIGGLKW